MTKQHPILTREWLGQRYVSDGARLADIAAEAQCSTTCVRNTIDRLGLPRRDDRAGRELKARWASFDLADAIRLYVDERKACNDIGALYGVNGCTVRRHLRRAGVAIRHHNDTKRGAKAKNRIDLDPERVAALYSKPGASRRSVAALVGASSQVVGRVLAEAGVPAKPTEPGRYAGSKNPNWRPDLTAAERAARRDMHKQARWRAKVYERDGYTCQCCGDARGGNLHAHHILDHATNPGDRWGVENGTTLCAPCHRAFHSAYGLTGVNRDMLDLFISVRRGPSLAA